MSYYLSLGLLSGPCSGRSSDRSLTGTRLHYSKPLRYSKNVILNKAKDLNRYMADPFHSSVLFLTSATFLPRDARRRSTQKRGTPLLAEYKDGN